MRSTRRAAQFLPNPCYTISYVLVEPKNPADVRKIKQQVAALGYLALTEDEFMQRTSNFYIYQTGGGTNMLIMTLISFIVGLSISGQTFYTFFLENLERTQIVPWFHSQADTEQAGLEVERAELEADDKGEHKELMAVYIDRGLDPLLAKQVADQLMAHDALGAHARDELGLSETLRARPIQAALASAASFAIGAALPLLVTAFAPEIVLIPLVAVTLLVLLALLGGWAARVGGARVIMGAIRVTFWGALAMAVTVGVGKLFGAVA